MGETVSENLQPRAVLPKPHGFIMFDAFASFGCTAENDGFLPGQFRWNQEYKSADRWFLLANKPKYVRPHDSNW